LRSNAADEGTVGIKQADKSGPGGKYGIMLEGILPREGRFALDRDGLRPLRSRQYDARGDIVSEFAYGETGPAPARRVAVSR